VLSLVGVHAVRSVPEPATTPRPTPHNVRLTGNGPIDVINPGEGSNQVVAVNAFTGRRVVTSQHVVPMILGISWSPDGTQLAYATTSGVFVLTPATGVTRFLGACSSFCAPGVAWSPNGRDIAVSNGGHLLLWSADGGRSKPIATLPAADAEMPSWSPDSNRLVFVVVGPNRRWAIDVVNADGSHLTTLVGPLPDDWVLLSPAWSPDGSQIAYLEGSLLHCPGPSIPAGPCYPGFPWHSWSVMLIHPDGSNPTRLLAAGSTIGGNPGLGWSPDGTSLALNIPGPTSGVPFNGMYVMNRDGSDLRLLDHSWDYYAFGLPAWQPIP
jgi:WD40 repeat protein